MKNRKLFEFMGNKRFARSADKFSSMAEPNPFGRTGKKDKISIDFDDDENMSEFVRGSKGLDKTSRALTGSQSGVRGSVYDDKVRNTNDIDPNVSPNNGEYPVDADMRGEEDDLYLSTKDRSYLQNEFNDEEDFDDIDAEAGWKFMHNLAANSPDDDNEDDDDLEEDDEFGDEDDEFGDEDDEFGDDDDEFDEYEGIIRSIKGAVLVSKKKQPDETYTEVWLYNVGKKYDDEANIRKSILSGTDIDPTKSFSEDGSQESVVTSVGNVQFLTLVGLPD